MSTIGEKTQTIESAKRNGFQFVGIFPQPTQPNRLHSRFALWGLETADLPFDAENKPVGSDSYALWVNPCAIANCGCVHHAEQGLPCEHDLAQFKSALQEIFG